MSKMYLKKKSDYKQTNKPCTCKVTRRVSILTEIIIYPILFKRSFFKIHVMEILFYTFKIYLYYITGK